MKIAELEIEVIKKNIKHLYLRVYPPDGRIRLMCPRSLYNRKIRQFALAKADWIRNQQARCLSRPRKLDLEYISGESVYYKGERLVLGVIYHSAAPKVVIEGTKLNLYVRYGSIREQREQALTNWYRQQLKAELPSAIAKWEKIVGVSINDWGVKKMKTRWGTCNVQARRIWLNLKLIEQPQRCLEYVVVHELVHLLEPTHNARFKAYMNQFMPHWQLYQQELDVLSSSF